MKIKCSTDNKDYLKVTESYSSTTELLFTIYEGSKECTIYFDKRKLKNLIKKFDKIRKKYEKI